MVFRRRLSLVLQESHDDCAYACFVMIARYYGHDCNIMGCREMLINYTSVPSIEDLIRLGEFFDFKTRASRVKCKELRQLTSPAILLIYENHFVVLGKFNDSEIHIFDPALGVDIFTWERLQTEFSGIIIEFYHHGLRRYRCRRSYRLKLLDWLYLVRDINKYTILQIAALVLIDIASSLGPLLNQQLINTRQSCDLPQLIITIVILWILLGSMQALNQWFRKRFFLAISESWALHVKSAVLQYLLHIPLHIYNRSTRADWYCFLALTDEIKSFLFDKWLPGLWDILLMFMMIMLCVVIFPPLTALLALSFAIQILLSNMCFRLQKQILQVAIHKKNILEMMTWQLLSAIKMIRAYSAEKHFVCSWAKRSRESQEYQIALSDLESNIDLLRQIVVNSDQIAYLFFALVAVREGSLSLGGMMALFAVKTQLQERFVSLLSLIASWRTLSISSQKLLAHFAKTPRITVVDESHFARKISGEIRIENLHYQKHLNNSSFCAEISFHLSVGERLVLTGESGSGKTTLLYHILGLYPSAGGVLFLDQYRFSKWTINDYGNNIACVLQDDYLWHGTLLDNIAFEQKLIDWDFLDSLLNNLHLHDVVNNLPMGLYTPVGEGRSQFSTGQLERIYLARALYKKPKIIFLDEATSHLDIQTDSQIDNFLRKSGITQIMTTHHEHLLKNSDRIIRVSSRL